MSKENLIEALQDYFMHKRICKIIHGKIIKQYKIAYDAFGEVLVQFIAEQFVADNSSQTIRRTNNSSRSVRRDILVAMNFFRTFK